MGAWPLALATAEPVDQSCGNRVLACMIRSLLADSGIHEAQRGPMEPGKMAELMTTLQA
jgi:hypothetical protein